MLTVINTQTPHSSDSARNALDMIMMAVSLDQPVQVIFMHDGVWQLINQQTQAIDRKNALVKYRILADVFEMDALYVCKQSLQDRQLQPDMLNISATAVDADTLQQKLAASNQIVRF